MGYMYCFKKLTSKKKSAAYSLQKAEFMSKYLITEDDENNLIVIKSNKGKCFRFECLEGVKKEDLR